MAWNDAPPSPDELGSASSGWANQAPTEEELAATKPIGKIESFARGAANNFPLAPQAIALGEKLVPGSGDYSENLADWNQKAQAAKTANPKTYGVGAVAGSLAPLAIPVVGEALEAAPVAGNAALGAANAISNTNLTKNPGTALLEGTVGALAGGTLGKVGDMVGSGLEALKPAAKRAGERLEANATASALDLGTYGTRRISKGLENPEKAMLDVNEKITRLFPDLVGYSDTSGSKYQKLLEGHKTAGNAIGEVVDSTSKQFGGQIPETHEAIGALEDAAAQYNGLTSARNSDAKAELTDLATKMKSLQQSGGLNFRALADLKTDIGHAYHDPNLQNHGIDQAYSILSDTMDKVLDRANVDNPAVKNGFDQAKEIYRLTSNILPAMKRGVIREVAGKSGGLTTAALGAGAIFGHPLAAGAGYAAKTAAHLGAPELGPNIAYKTVNALKNSSLLSGAIKSLPGVRQGATQEMLSFIQSHYGNRDYQE